MSEATSSLTQGIREHLPQFSLHVLLVFATGLTIGSERAVVPVLARDVFGLESFVVIGSFVVTFGFTKALINLYAGKWGEGFGRRPVLVAGWATALPLPVILIFAPNWWWITFGNILLGVNQGLTWSMAVNAKIDLAGADQRGLAVGIDEAFGYTGLAVGAWITGVIAARTSLRPEPFYFLAVVVVVHSAMYFLQIGTGGLADRIGRRPPVIAGMFLAGAGVLGMVVVEGYLAWAVLAGVSGVGMALLYPNLMTVPGDACHPTWRATGMGVYRMWRDAGYGVGGLDWPDNGTRDCRSGLLPDWHSDVCVRDGRLSLDGRNPSGLRDPRTACSSPRRPRWSNSRRLTQLFGEGRRCHCSLTSIAVMISQ
jgi:MFS family permease